MKVHLVGRKSAPFDAMGYIATAFGGFALHRVWGTFGLNGISAIMDAQAASLENEGATPQVGMQDVLLLVGQLNYTWTNTESLLIYLIAGLARVDKETAIVIFLTLNTTRARIDLVERLAKMPKTSAGCRGEVLDLMKRLSREAALRNKFNHCIYSFDPESGSGATQLMRIFDDKSEIKYGKVEQLDAREIEKIRTSIATITAINKAIWTLARRYDFPV